MDSIWTIDVVKTFESSVVDCEICTKPRTQLVKTVDPFGTEHEQYSLCDAPECLERLEDLTIGDEKDRGP